MAVVIDFLVVEVVSRPASAPQCCPCLHMNAKPLLPASDLLELQRHVTLYIPFPWTVYTLDSQLNDLEIKQLVFISSHRSRVRLRILLTKQLQASDVMIVMVLLSGNFESIPWIWSLQHSKAEL